MYPFKCQSEIYFVPKYQFLFRNEFLIIKIPKYQFCIKVPEYKIDIQEFLNIILYFLNPRALLLNWKKIKIQVEKETMLNLFTIQPQLGFEPMPSCCFQFSLKFGMKFRVFLTHTQIQLSRDLIRKGFLPLYFQIFNIEIVDNFYLLLVCCSREQFTAEKT